MRATNTSYDKYYQCLQLQFVADTKANIIKNLYEYLIPTSMVPMYLSPLDSSTNRKKILHLFSYSRSKGKLHMLITKMANMNFLRSNCKPLSGVEHFEGFINTPFQFLHSDFSTLSTNIQSGIYTKALFFFPQMQDVIDAGSYLRQRDADLSLSYGNRMTPEWTWADLNPCYTLTDGATGFDPVIISLTIYNSNAFTINHTLIYNVDSIVTRHFGDFVFRQYMSSNTNNRTN